MLVDSVDARRASIARMPGSQVVRKMERERERGGERTDEQASQRFPVSAEAVSVCVDGFRCIPVSLAPYPKSLSHVKHSKAEKNPHIDCHDRPRRWG